jgi:hypothetical protein
MALKGAGYDPEELRAVVESGSGPTPIAFPDGICHQCFVENGSETPITPGMRATCGFNTVGLACAACTAASRYCSWTAWRILAAAPASSASSLPPTSWAMTSEGLAALKHHEGTRTALLKYTGNATGAAEQQALADPLLGQPRRVPCWTAVDQIWYSRSIAAKTQRKRGELHHVVVVTMQKDEDTVTSYCGPYLCESAGPSPEKYIIGLRPAIYINDVQAYMQYVLASDMCPACRAASGQVLACLSCSREDVERHIRARTRKDPKAGDQLRANFSTVVTSTSPVNAPSSPPGAPS